MAQAPNFSTQTNGYDANTVESVNGGFDPNRRDTGGYDPSNPSKYFDNTQSLGGRAAITDEFNAAPSFNAPSNGYDPNTVESTGGGYDGSQTAYDLLDPKNARLANSGLKEGATGTGEKAEPNIGFENAASGGIGGAAAAAEDDWRVRVSLAPGAKIFYQAPAIKSNELMYPLVETNGVIWPYTPQITVTHNANYTSAALTHSNYAAHFYNNSEVADIQISGDFTVQSIEDGQYLMAAIYFFRSATKMFFGQGSNMGNPPPVVFLDGYGSHYFPHVPCVVSSFAHTLPNEVDYIEIPISYNEIDTSSVDPNRQVQLTAQDEKYVPSLLRSETQATTKSTQSTVRNSRTKSITTHTRVPTTSTLSVTLKPVYSRKNLSERFDLDKFAQGLLLRDKDKGFGGFL